MREYTVPGKCRNCGRKFKAGEKATSERRGDFAVTFHADACPTQHFPKPKADGATGENPWILDVISKTVS